MLLQAQNAQMHDHAQTEELGCDETLSYPLMRRLIYDLVSKRRRIVPWLGPCDFKTDLDRHLNARHPGTCDWIFDEPVFQKRRMTDSNNVLWFNARPDSGKSVCSAATVERLRVENCDVAYFLIKSNDPIRRRLLRVLRNMAAQMLRIVPYIPDELFNLHIDDIGQPYVQNVGAVEKVLSCLQKHVGRIHLIIDGLDECDDRTSLTESLGKLFSQNTTGISKWFCATCKSPDFEILLENVQGELIEISTKNAQIDYENVDISLKRKEYISHIQGEAKRNFLWTQLMLHAFTGRTCEEDVEDGLGNYHLGLGGCYLLHLSQLSRKVMPTRTSAVS